MSTEYLDSLKERLKDLPEFYIKMVDENFEKYVRYRMEQGQSVTRILSGLGDAEEIAQHYEFFYKIHQIHGRRQLKGAGPLIKQALDKGVLSYQLYRTNKSKLIFKSILMFVIGVCLSTAGAGFLIGNIDNPWGLNMSVVALSIFIFMCGIYSFYYILILRHRFQNDMLSASMDGCNLQYFGT